MSKPDPSNKFFVGVGGGGIDFVLPIPRHLSKADALVLAAWLVALAEDPEDEDLRFAPILDAVRST